MIDIRLMSIDCGRPRLQESLSLQREIVARLNDSEDDRFAYKEK